MAIPELHQIDHKNVGPNNFLKNILPAPEILKRHRHNFLWFLEVLLVIKRLDHLYLTKPLLAAKSLRDWPLLKMGSFGRY